MSPKKAATKKAPAKRKRSKKKPGAKVPFEKMVLAAYHVICGDTEVLIAERLGVTDRTIRNWKAHARWPEALAEAERRWFPATRHAAMAAIGRSIKRGNVQVAQWFAERQIPELAPPKVKQEIGGKDGGPIEVTVTRRIVRPDAEN